MSVPRLEILPNPQELALRVADWMCEVVAAQAGVIAIVLSGGSTPRRLYEALAAPPYSDRFPWARVHFFWGDERFVPHGDPRSNFRMVREAMLSRVPVPPANIHPIPTESITLKAAAEAYEEELETFRFTHRAGADRPCFDLTLLGLGEDGHLASLFPGHEAEFSGRMVAATRAPDAEPRITLTYRALQSTGHAAFLVTGAEKHDIFERIRRGEPDLPAVRYRPTGDLIWFVDRAVVDGDGQ